MIHSPPQVTAHATGLCLGRTPTTSTSSDHLDYMHTIGIGRLNPVLSYA